MTGCDNYKSGVGEMWPWCLNCGRHLLAHKTADNGQHITTADPAHSGRAES